MTTVTYNIAYLRSLPGYENVRVEYGVTDDVQDGETIDEAKDRITSKVDYWLQNRVEEIDREVAGN